MRRGPARCGRSTSSDWLINTTTPSVTTRCREGPWPSRTPTTASRSLATSSPPSRPGEPWPMPWFGPPAGATDQPRLPDPLAPPSGRRRSGRGEGGLAEGRRPLPDALGRHRDAGLGPRLDPAVAVLEGAGGAESVPQPQVVDGLSPCRLVRREKPIGRVATGLDG